MARLAVLASGSGSNFEAIVSALRTDGRHEIAILVSDRKRAYALERAARLGVKAAYVTFVGRTKAEAEAEISALLESEGVELVALAGYMRIMGPEFVGRWRGRLVNLHPSLLPLYPGAHGIRDSYMSDDRELGISVHYVDEGMDTGGIIAQYSIPRVEGETLEGAESRIHQLEHRHYPAEIIKLMSALPTAAAGEKK